MTDQPTNDGCLDIIDEHTPTLTVDLDVAVDISPRFRDDLLAVAHALENRDLESAAVLAEVLGETLYGFSENLADRGDIAEYIVYQSGYCQWLINTRNHLFGHLRYLQDKVEGCGSDSGNYRRNAARELDQFAEHIEDYVVGESLEREGSFFPPMVLIDTPEECPAASQEVFGPIAAVFEVSISIKSSSERTVRSSGRDERLDGRPEAMRAASPSARR